MVMVDKMYSFTDTAITAGLRVHGENLFVSNGHLSEAGLIEHMAQSVALHTGYSFYLRQAEAPVGYIGTIKSIEISRLPAVNDEIKTTVTILHEFGGVTLVDLSTTLGNVEIAAGQMKTILAK